MDYSLKMEPKKLISEIVDHKIFPIHSVYGYFGLYSTFLSPVNISSSIADSYEKIWYDRVVKNIQ